MSRSDGVTGGEGAVVLPPSPTLRRALRGRRGQPLAGPAWKLAKRWLYVFHRWTGIILCLFFAIWFVSGVVMMYVPFPSFRGPERVATAPVIDWAQVRVGPDKALGSLRETAFPAEMRLGMTGGSRSIAL